MSEPNGTGYHLGTTGYHRAGDGTESGTERPPLGGSVPPGGPPVPGPSVLPTKNDHGAKAAGCLGQGILSLLKLGLVAVALPLLLLLGSCVSALIG